MQSILRIKRIMGAVGYGRLLPVLALFAWSQSLHAQTVTLRLTNTPLKEVFSQIKKQTGYHFIYASEFLKDAKPVSISVTNAPLEEVLKLCFKDQPIIYAIDEKFIVVRKKEAPPAKDKTTIDLRGRVLNEQGEGIEGASVIVKGAGKGTVTNERGEFLLKEVEENAMLEISSVGYTVQQVFVGKASFITIHLNVSVQLLDETVIKGYYSTNKRLNTGNVSKVRGEDIQKQPVSNPLQAIQGRVPGLVISQANGLSGSAVNIQIRGRNSISQGSDPLFVIDGVPFAPGNGSLSQVFSALNANAGVTGMSPFGLINPSDIESIEVLKDADATSIYGSRGANGVILITTKKGKAGKTKLQVNYYNGFSKPTRTMDLLNTQQYLQTRREAFVNDNVVPDYTNAYDLLLWDTTRYTDFKKLLIGETAATRDVQVGISGGNATTQFTLGGGYHHETTVFPGDFALNRGSTHFSINHSTDNKKFSVGLLGYYSFSKNNILTTDLTSAVNALPNLPDLYDSTGALNWNYKGVTFVNPLSFLKSSYRSKANLLNASMQLHYKILEGLSIGSSFGYNRNDMDELSTNPIRSQNPAVNPTGSSNFGNAEVEGWIIEPQLKYENNTRPGRIQILLGGTIQKNTAANTLINANGYTNDNLLKDINAAASVTASDDYREYRYQALFGRLNYNWKDKYVLNLTGRRDGSSRFGPGKQFANFGSAGFAWIFSNEDFVKKNLRFLNYGKLRGSYGSSGNDQIGDYRYLSAWTATRYPYQGNSGLYPNNLYNPDYSWEINRKMEAGLELSLWNEGLFFTASYFRNRSGNQLINYQLPYQTGFFDITQNLPAFIQNTGMEFEVVTKNIQRGAFNWSTSFNLTVPKNKLLAFPGIETSSYSYLVINEPLSVYGGFRFLGVDPQTGVYQFADKDGKPTSSPSPSKDYINNLGNLEPTFYGGLLNRFTYKTFAADVFFEFKKQTGANYLSFLTSNIPGTITNQFTNVMDRWRVPGDVSVYQKFTQGAGSAASQAASIFRLYGNDGKYGDASYIRLKNISLAYSFPATLLRKLHLEDCRIYMQGQNILTITNYVGSDPETKNIASLPPLRTITAGIQLGL